MRVRPGQTIKAGHYRDLTRIAVDDNRTTADCSAARAKIAQHAKDWFVDPLSAESPTGVGILDEDLPFVFEKFFRGRPAATPPGEGEPAEFPSERGEAPGVGLGLYLARSIINRLGGTVTVESPPPGEVRGTAFTVRLPLWSEEDGAAASDEVEDVEAVTRG